MGKVNKPVISVVVQTKNTPLMIIKRCIKSIREQTLSSIEIILLDSNDKDSQYKTAIQDEKDLYSSVTYLEVPETGEFVEGKNTALNIYHGDYITFISSQDIMPPTRLQGVIDTFKEDYSYNAVYTDMSIQPNNILEVSEPEQTFQELKYLAQIVFHRNCFEWIEGFDPDLVAHCDDEINIKLHTTKMMHHVSSPETTLLVCPDCYNNFTPLESAIGYRQLGVKYDYLFKKHKKNKKELYQNIATEYKKAGVFHRYIQFKTKAFFIRVRKSPEEREAELRNKHDKKHLNKHDKRHLNKHDKRYINKHDKKHLNKHDKRHRNKHDIRHRNKHDKKRSTRRPRE